MNDVYGAFSEQLRRAQNGEISLLDDEDGLLIRWSAICEERLAAISVDLDPEETTAWTLERNTWQLVQALYAERLSPESIDDVGSPSPMGSTSKNPYTPPLTVAQRLIGRDKKLVELSAIRDWLHSIPTSLNPAEIRRGYLPYTKNKLKQARRTGQDVPRGLVNSLDPDAVLRGAERDNSMNEEKGARATVRLDGDDDAYDRALLRSLFEYVRAGELDLAIDMCRQSDQSWRAASLSGGKLWWDPVLAPGEEGYDEDMQMDEGAEQMRARGVKNRRLWKMMCRKLATAPYVDAYERALYGAISGSVDSVLPVCTSWEDHVWTHVNALLESQIEAGLSSSSEGRYWSRGTTRSVKDIGGSSTLDLEDELLGSAGRGASVEGELEALFDRLMRLEKGDLSASAKDPFHVSQTYLMVGKVSELFTTFVERLEQSAYDTEPETLAHLLRFFAHLILVLRLMKQPLPEVAANQILEAYVNVLDASDQDENLIAFYASHLNNASAVESYAKFLLTFGADSDVQARYVALLKAREHGLDLAKIACRTVELTLRGVEEDLEDVEHQSKSTFDAYAKLDPRMLELIRSVEWLTFDKSTYKEALVHANALNRYFLSTDKPQASRELLLRLPRDLIDSAAASVADMAGTSEKDGTRHTGEIEGEEILIVKKQIKEYLDYSNFFMCLEKHTRWAEVWSRKPRATASKIDQATYKEGIVSLVEDFNTSTLDLLESDWLKLDPRLLGSSSLGMEEQDDDVVENDFWQLNQRKKRRVELARIRKALVPHLVFRLHHTLYETGDMIPTNLQKALELSNTVADERFQLYLEFIPPSPLPPLPSSSFDLLNQVTTGINKNQLKDYLVLVREVCLAILDKTPGGRDPFSLFSMEDDDDGGGSGLVEKK